jgi:demethylmenaquinone methyltransferase/2-methoxy-6-polyprenyl-1,4-benzoquinol methylase
VAVSGGAVAGGDPFPTDDDALPEGDEKRRAVRAMFDRISARYDRVNAVLTFGLDSLWRRRTLRDAALAPGSVVVDLACGTGDFVDLLAREGHVTVGVDLSHGMLVAGSHRLPRARFVEADAARLPFDDASVDAVTCGFALRNFVDLDAVLRECARVLRPGGTVALLEVAEPRNPLLRSGHALYFRRIVPLIGGLLSDRAAYRYLPKSTAYLPPPAQLVADVADAGFDDVDRRLLSGGISQRIIGRRSPDGAST